MVKGLLCLKQGSRIPHDDLMVTLSAAEIIFPGERAWVGIAFKLHVLLHLGTLGSLR